MLMAILYQFIKALFMITPTQQIVCSIISRQLIVDLSPTSRQPVADQSQPISNQLAVNRPPVADRSPTGRRCLGIVVADQSLIDLQLKNAVFDRSGCIVCSCCRQVAVHVWPGLNLQQILQKIQYWNFACLLIPWYISKRPTLNHMLWIEFLFINWTIWKKK